MKIVIVGGTGNISVSITKLLLEQGHDVTCYNRGQSGVKIDGARELVGDRQDREAFEATMQREKFDAAIDMICYNREDAASSLRAFAGVSQLVYCSTVCTYGVKAHWLPITEDHPLEPISDYGRNKVAADNLFLEAYYREGFPVTIIKPSTTIGPKMGLLRQVAWEFSWIDRIRKGKPILVCGDGVAMHQFLDVKDAALGFAGALKNPHCKGQVYNLVKAEFFSWAAHHRLAMKVLGREVELVGISLSDIIKFDIPAHGVCRDIFAHNNVYSGDKIQRDIPDFQPQIPLETTMAEIVEAMDATNRVPNSDEISWEDEAIKALRH